MKHTQPREMAELKGATRVHPERYRSKVPKSELPLGEFPKKLSTSPADCWFEISSMCIPGVLTGADRIMLEIASNLLAEYRTNPVEFQVGKYTHMISCLARFGMSPSDRTKLGLDEKESDNPFANLDD